MAFECFDGFEEDPAVREEAAEMRMRLALTTIDWMLESPERPGHYLALKWIDDIREIGERLGLR